MFDSASVRLEAKCQRILEEYSGFHKRSAAESLNQILRVEQLSPIRNNSSRRRKSILFQRKVAQMERVPNRLILQNPGLSYNLQHDSSNFDCSGVEPDDHRLFRQGPVI